VGESFSLGVGLPLFSQHQQCRRRRQDLLLGLQRLLLLRRSLRLEGLELFLILSVELVELLLLRHRAYRPGIGRRGCVPRQPPWPTSLSPERAACLSRFT
jgi:hypothetical protein